MEQIIKQFIQSNLKNTKGGVFGLDRFEFYNMKLETEKFGFLGGGIHKHKIYKVYLNGKLIRKFIDDYCKMTELVYTYGKLKYINNELR